MRFTLLTSCVFFLACVQAAPPAGPTPHLLSFGGDVVGAPTGVASEALHGGGAPSPNRAGDVLYLSFGGEVLTAGADYAPGNTSAICGNQFPPFDGAVNAPKVSQSDAIEAVVDRVRTFFAPYDVHIVTTRPTSGSFTMIVVGGTHDTGCQPMGVAGVSATVDCNNSNLNNVVLDFSTDQTPDFGGVVAVAVTAAHESGHSYGLEHTDNASDIMYSVMTPAQTIQNVFNLSFGSGNFSPFNAGSIEPTTEVCGRSGTLDNDAILKTNLGASVRADAVKPTLTWTFPSALPEVTPSFPVSFTASDNVGVKKIEIYKNFELVAVLRSPPYTATLTAASGEQFYLTAEAVDDAANRTSITRGFIADAKNPPLCPDGSCPAGRTCKEGLCRMPLGSSCATSIDCTTSFCRTVGGATDKTCTAVCSATMPCPESGMCAGGLCVPTMMTMMPKNVGDACGAASECASGRCATTCVPACDATACDPSASCMAVDGGMGCVTNGAMPMPASGGCTLEARAPNGAGVTLVLVLAALGLRRRRRV